MMVRMVLNVAGRETSHRRPNVLLRALVEHNIGGVVVNAPEIVTDPVVPLELTLDGLDSRIGFLSRTC